MAPDRSDQVSQLYHAALQRPREARESFLIGACAGDEALRQEVESLLGYESASSRFLETPAGIGPALGAASRANASTVPEGQLMTSPAPRLAPGTMVGRYRIQALAGVGGMGEVYRARDTRLDRTIALKALPAHLRASPQRRARFEREARAVARLRHPHICTLHDVGHEEGLDFLVMEYIEGETLGRKLESGALTVADALRLSSEVASALGAAHAKGLIHRDIKPSNIIVTPDGHAIVVDFGLARDASGFAPLDGAPLPALSHCGDRVGTPSYMSPEQALGQPLDPRTDIFSLGVVLFECLTGRLPFDGTTGDDYRHNLLSTDAKPLADFRAETPAALQHLVAACLEKDVSRRIDSATSLSTALSQLATGGDVVDLPRPHPLRFRLTRLKRRVSPLAAAGLAGGIALAGGVAWWARMPPPWTAPTVLAILPPANPADNPIAEQLGAATVSVVSRNLGTWPRLEIVSRELTAPYASARADLTRLKDDGRVSYVLDFTVRQTSPAIEIFARLRRPGVEAPAWEQAFTGNAVEVQTSLLAKLRETLAPDGIRARLRGERAPPATLPTVDSDALMGYIEARALLDRPEESGNVQRAMELLDRAAVADPRFALAHAGLADALRARFTATRDRTHLDRATQSATTAVQLDSESSAAHVSFAAVQYQRAQLDAAVKSLHRALDLQPDNDDAHRWLGEALAEQGQVDAGVAELRTALRIRPSFTSYYRLGAVLFKASRFAAALEAYGRAIEIRPGHVFSYEMLGASQDMLGHFDKAIGYYEHALRLGAGATTHANLAMAYFGAGDFQKARTAALDAIARDPKKASAYRTLGDVYLKLNRKGEARANYEKAIQLSRAVLEVNSKDAFAIVLIAICDANLGRRANAEKQAAEARALLPSNRDILYRVAKVYALTGNQTAALEALRGAVEHGYDRDAARRDPELGSLRSSPEFEKVLSDEVRR